VTRNLQPPDKASDKPRTATNNSYCQISKLVTSAIYQVTHLKLMPYIKYIQ
jgi:hypothetical protein